MDKLLDKCKLWYGKFTEALTSCMLCMVGGDLSVLQWYHWGVAAKVGAASATALVLTTLIMKVPNRWALAWLTGIIVMVADVVLVTNHAHIFGESQWREGAVTGVGAALLGLLMHNLYRK